MVIRVEQLRAEDGLVLTRQPGSGRRHRLADRTNRSILSQGQPTEVPMKLAALAVAALFALSTTAYAECGQHACVDGFTWSSDAGTCVPKTVSS